MKEIKEKLVEQLTVEAGAKPDNLTFSELRLANMLHALRLESEQTRADAPESLAQSLADMVIRIDRLAAREGIDLAQAIRKRFMEL